MDNISLLIILRALFIYYLLEKGWCVKRTKSKKDTFEIFKSVKTTI
jgi:hypothetical protein